MSVLPGSLWLAYALTDAARVQRMLPPGLRIAPVAPLASDEPARGEALFMNAYQLSSKWMNGYRVDVQVFARDELTGSPHLVLLDVASTTLDWNPVDGLVLPNARRTAMEPMLDGEAHHFGIAREDGGVLRVAGRSDGQSDINQEFAVDANRRCYFRGDPRGYELAFDEALIGSPVRVVQADVRNTLWSDVRSTQPSHVFAHSRPMTFDVRGAFPW